MTERSRTTPERLARIETLLEGINKRLDKMEDSAVAAKAALDADKADLDKLKNRGAGLLIGVGLFAGALGAKMESIIAKIFS